MGVRERFRRLLVSTCPATQAAILSSSQVPVKLKSCASRGWTHCLTQFRAHPILSPVLGLDGYYEPASTDEALDILRRGNGNYKPFAGGTDVIINLRRRTANYHALVNIKRLPGIASWSNNPGEGLHIGAATPFRDLESSPSVTQRYCALAESIRVIGSVQLRNLATIGGNLCNASPAADSATALIVSKATATFTGNGEGPQSCLVEQFFAGPGRSILSSDRLLLSLDIPEPEPNSGDCFQRFTPRGALDIGIASAASRITLDRSSGRVQEAVIALGAVAPTPVRAAKAEEALVGHEPTPDRVALAANIAKEECNPISDIRGSASYRQALVEVLVRRTLEQAVERAQT